MAWVYHGLRSTHVYPLKLPIGPLKIRVSTAAFSVKGRRTVRYVSSFEAAPAL